MKIRVVDTVDAGMIKRIAGDNKPVDKWCECEASEFWFFAEDNACVCGVEKHHVHCSNCCGISQVG